MKTQIVIDIRGSQVVDGEKQDDVEITTVADRYDKGEVRYIRYQESELTGFEGCTTTLKIEPKCKKLTMIRDGNGNRSQLLIEEGIRHQCTYFNGMADMTLGVTCDHFSYTMDEEGGRLLVEYTLDINSFVVSENGLYVGYHQGSFVGE